MRILAKPKSIKNPHLPLLYEGLTESHGVRADEFNLYRILFGRYDILHIHWPDRVLSWAAPRFVSLVALEAMLMLARVRGIRVVWTCHNLRPKTSVSRFYKRWYISVLRRWVNAIIVPRDDLSAKVKRLFPASKIIAIPLGLYPISPKRRPTVIAEVFGEQPPPKGTAVLIPGFQERSKRVEDAVSAVLTLLSDCTVVVVGSFPDTAHFREVADRFRGERRVVLVNRFLDEEELWTLIEYSKCVVSSQKGSTNSGVALLAISLGRPCFCTTKRLAASIRFQYHTNLCWGLPEIRDCDMILRATGSRDEMKAHDMKAVANRTYRFFCDMLAQ